MPSKMAICYTLISWLCMRPEILWMSFFHDSSAYILLLIIRMHTICSNAAQKNTMPLNSMQCIWCIWCAVSAFQHYLIGLIISVWGSVIPLWSMFSLPPLRDFSVTPVFNVLQGVMYGNHFHNGFFGPLGPLPKAIADWWLLELQLDTYWSNPSGLSAHSFHSHYAAIDLYFSQFLLLSALEHLCTVENLCLMW